jgi:hypothetical protein
MNFSASATDRHARTPRVTNGAASPDFAARILPVISLIHIPTPWLFNP